MEYINIDTRQEFEQFLDDLKRAKIVVADTETNGLRYYRDSYVISISVYFPEFDRNYNIPYRHGEGVIDVTYTDKTQGKEFAELNWQGKTKTQLFLRYWWSKFREMKQESYFGNLPEEWVDEIKALWGAEGVSYVFHNARFDLHMLEAEGFPKPHIVEDTMIALHIVQEDWKGINIDAPYKQKGLWVIGEDGKPHRKKMRGNRQLKFQSMLFDLPNAHVGEAELIQAKEALEEDITSFIMAHLKNWYLGYPAYDVECLITDSPDPYLDGLIYADILKRKEGAWDKWGEKQEARVRAKVALDSKANMWMLPSDKVALYAMLDTALTWQLREKLMPIMRRWHNEELYHNLCDIQLNVAWIMENNGLYIDMDEARKQVRIYEPRITEIEQKFDELATALSEAGMFDDPTACPDCKGTGIKRKKSKGKVTSTDCKRCDATGKTVLDLSEINARSNKMLPPFLRQAVTVSFGDLDEFIPSWVDSQTKAQLSNEPFRVKTGQLMLANKEALEPFKEHPVVWLLLEYRKLQKTVNTYLSNWMSARDASSIVRGSLDITGTVAGRMSSYGDMGNLQNIPERGGYTVKRAFVALPKHILFAIDYGQLEARLAAWIAEVLLPMQGAYVVEPTMVNLFLGGADMHAYVRDMINVREIMFGSMSDIDIMIWAGEPYENKTEKQIADYIAKKICRQIAKTLNFGLLYSGTFRMIMKLLRIGEVQSKELERRWRNLFPAFAMAQAHYERLALTYRPSPDGTGYGMYVTQPITGRHRKLHLYDTVQSYFDDATNSWKTFNPRQANARKTWNNIVQGLGGWMSVNAMNNYYHDNGYGGMKPYAQIHDALDGQCHVDELGRVVHLMDYMIDYDTKPNLTVDLEAGWNWQPYSDDNLLGMREVHDVDLWIASKGQEGYE